MTEPSKNIVILAPHVDDEVIGCWRLLEDKKVRKVIYFSEVTTERNWEISRSSYHFDFSPIRILTPDPSATLDLVRLELREGDVIYAPNCRDHHPMHKWVNNYVAKKLLPAHTVRFYSVDMNVKKDVLSAEQAARKKERLLDCFPSQADLFKDAKYYLFESDLADDRTTTIEVTFGFEGIHHYPKAPEEVLFLRYPHRHVFHVTAELQVWHDDRDVEFIMFKRELQALVSDGNMNHKSCEMIAKDIMDYIVAKYPDRNCKVKVSEDNENAAIVEYKLWD